jgi:hypothetical protein
MGHVMKARWLVLFSFLAACASPSGEDTSTVGLRAATPLPARHGTVIVDGCMLDTWQRATLASPPTRRVISEVVMLCLVPRLDGTVGPRDPSALAQIDALSKELKGYGYQFDLAMSFTDESGQRYDGQQQKAFMADPKWRAQLTSTLIPLMGPADGIDIDFGGELPLDARESLTALITEVSNVVRPAKQLAIHVPPSVTNPSDLPNGEAFSRTELAKLVDRMRVMTLDFSIGIPGPTIDPGWAVDAARLALADFPKVDISYPLYGTDFGPHGPRSVTYFEAMGVASATQQPISRGPSGAPWFSFVNEENERHTMWFDDADSTGIALGAWSYEVLPPSVGVVFYGLGAEDPTLFEKLAQRLP